MAKLTNAQWAEARAAWESDAREGFQWLVDELALPVSRPAVSRRAESEGWSKAAPAAPGQAHKAPHSPQKRDDPAPNQAMCAAETPSNHGSTAAAMRQTGQPDKYHASYADMANRLCLAFGATDAQLAEWFGVSEQIIQAWKLAHPDFLHAIQQGKAIADANVARSLYARATGYSHPDVHVSVWQGEAIITPITKHFPPDVSAAKYWLNNRQPARWRNQMEVDVSATISKPNVAELDAIYAAGMEKIRQSREAMQQRRRELAQEAAPEATSAPAARLYATGD